MMERHQFDQLLKQTAQTVEQALLDREVYSPSLALLKSDPCLSELSKAQNYSLMAGGKRIRPVLVMQVCAALDGESQSALPFACAIEMIHTYSLIHDDLPCMDNDDLRRGKPTNHKVFGEATAILAADALLTDAFCLVASAPHVSKEHSLLAVQLLSQAAGSAGMVGGQMMDMAGESKRLSLEELTLLHKRKTGALIGAAVALGAVAAGHTPQSPVWEPLMLYAQSIGLCFQIVDDILDVTADAALLGKTVGKDQTADKTTYMSYYSVEEASRIVKEKTQQACLAIREIDRDGFLTALAQYLAQRLY